MKSKTVFISGVAGFIGSHLADLYLNRGYRVIGADNLSGGDLDRVPSGVEFYSYDISDLDKNIKFTKGVDLVFHTACYAYDSFSNFSPSSIVNNVVATTSSLLSAVIQNGAEKFVHFSSMARYGGLNPSTFSEEMLPQPASPYGIAKYAADLLVKNLSETYNLKYAICIPHNVYGPRQTYNDPFRNVIVSTINRVLLGEAPILYGDGEQKRSFTYIDDCVRAVSLVAERDECNGHLVNVGPDKEFISVKEAICLILDKMGRPLQPVHQDARVNEVVDANCSEEKLFQLAGHSSTIDLSTGLDRTIDWIRRRGPKPFKVFRKIEIRSPLVPLPWREL